MGLFGDNTTITTTFAGKDNLSPVVRGMRSTMQQFKRDAMGGFGLAAGFSVFGLATRGIGMVTDALGDAVGSAIKFEDQLRTINTVAQVSDETLKGIGDEIQALARETGQSTDDLTSGFYDLVSAGVAADDAIGVLRDGSILAIGALGTTAETVDLLTTALNAYGLEAKESTRLTDIFAQAVEDGKIVASELGQTFATVAPIAANAGVEVEELAAAYAELSAQGVKAATIATDMRSALVALITPNEQLLQVQDEVNINFAQMAKQEGLIAALEALRRAVKGDMNVFGQALARMEALSFAVATTGENFQSFNDELERMTTAADKGGVALRQYEERNKSLAREQAQMGALFETALQDLGEGLTPAIHLLNDTLRTTMDVLGGVGFIFNEFNRTLNPGTANLQDYWAEVKRLGKEVGITSDEAIDIGNRILDLDRIWAQDQDVNERNVIMFEKVRQAMEELAASDALEELAKTTQVNMNEFQRIIAAAVARGKEEIIEVIPDAIEEMAVSTHDRLTDMRRGVKEDMADIVWAMKRPFAEENLEDWIKRKLDRIEKMRRRAVRQGNDNAIADLDAFIAKWRPRWEELVGITRSEANKIKSSIRSIGATIAGFFDAFDLFEEEVGTLQITPRRGGKGEGSRGSKGGGRRGGRGQGTMTLMSAPAAAMGGGGGGDVYLDGEKVGKMLDRRSGRALAMYGVSARI